MFSIRKKHKVQVYYFHNPSHEEILKTINSKSEIASDMVSYLQQTFQERTNEVLEKPDLTSELDSLWISELKEFFLQFPSTWSDLKRKLHAFRSMKRGVAYIEHEDEEYILPVFLRLNSGNNTSIGIEHSIRNEIFNNQKLLDQAYKEPSLLDSSHGNLSFLKGKNKREKIISEIIRKWLQSNIDTYNDDEKNTHIKELLPHMIKYLRSIFDIDFSDIGKIPSIDALSTYIVKKIWKDCYSGNDAKKAWMLAKSFTAWWSYEEIKKLRQKAEEKSKKIPWILESLGIEVWEITKNGEQTPWNEVVKIHTAIINVPLNDWRKLRCQLDYRVKSMRSILLKLWENEDYNNIDALRDMIGLAVIYPDDTSEADKVEVIAKLSQLMTNKWYVIKDKWALGNGGLKNLKNILKWDTLKKPLGKPAKSKKSKSSEEFKNASISGFAYIDGENIWMEIQFHDQKGYNYWKTEHYLFDPRKIISAWSRGSWFFTPHQLLSIIRREIPEDIREGILKMRAQDIIREYINKEYILAYKWPSWEVYFTPKASVKNFEEKFPTAKLIEKEDSGLITFVDRMSIN